MIKKFTEIRPEYNGIEVFDILDQPYDLEKIQVFIENELRMSKHRLDLNYATVLATLDSYSMFNIIEKDKSIIAFGGLQTKFRNGYARVITRTFLSHKYRTEGLSHRTFPDLATGVLLPIQTEKALSLGYDKVFFSIEKLNRRKYAGKLAINLSDYYNQNWKLLDGFYCTCPEVKDVKNSVKGCWQNIVYLDNGLPFELSKISIEEYKTLDI